MSNTHTYTDLHLFCPVTVLCLTSPGKTRFASHFTMSEAFSWMAVDLSEKVIVVETKKNLKVSGGKGSRMDSQTPLPLMNKEAHRTDCKKPTKLSARKNPK